MQGKYQRVQNIKAWYTLQFCFHYRRTM